MSLDRRSFLRSLLPAAAGVIVAPTLAETLALSSRKYFFISDNPLAPVGNGIEIVTTLIKPCGSSTVLGFRYGCAVSKINDIIVAARPLPKSMRILPKAEDVFRYDIRRAIFRTDRRVVEDPTYTNSLIKLAEETTFEPELIWS
jgi:hypothetical protein